ncbi:uncharacterized protein LOC134255273 [Saccostrea cucullata]|uniref:uncharacterized protein LOC134255273 n=1 Tax=Saccostrea cuccullata TaxID=36930 RepID=UPI002ED279C7
MVSGVYRVSCVRFLSGKKSQKEGGSVTEFKKWLCVVNSEATLLLAIARSTTCTINKIIQTRNDVVIPRTLLHIGAQLKNPHGRKTDRTFVSPSLCAARSAGQITVSSSLNSFPDQTQDTSSGTTAPKRLNVGKLKLSSSQYFADTLDERLNSTALDDHDVEAAWSTLRNTVYNTAFECRGPSTRKHKDWQERRSEERSQHSTAKAYDMQDPWLNAKADEIQRYADSHDRKNFYRGLKEVYGPTPSVPINQSLEAVPTLEEIQKAISLLSTGKAPGGDSIQAEIYKEGSMAQVEKLHYLFELIWDQKKVPQVLKDASIIHLYKRKRNTQACDNYRGISLLTIAGKTLARVLLNRLIKHFEDGLLPESQCGFRKNRGTIDMVFAARQLQEKCQEQISNPYSTYVDLTKAFDTEKAFGEL